MPHWTITRTDWPDLIVEGDTRIQAIEQAARDGDLPGANLSGLNLTGANLARTNLYRANLAGTDLTLANLSGASLAHANLYGANLSGAYLYSASMSSVNLTHANVTNATLTGADLTYAQLTACDLAMADLSPIRGDFWTVLDAAPLEVEALRDALESGKVDGGVYSGPCSCLIGTIATARHMNYVHLGELCPELHYRPSRPAEKWFLPIRPGDTRASNEIVDITLRWIEDWRFARK